MVRCQGIDPGRQRLVRRAAVIVDLVRRHRVNQGNHHFATLATLDHFATLDVGFLCGRWVVRGAAVRSVEKGDPLLH